jgi:integrase
VNTQTTEEIAMARVNQRLWKLPGQRTKRKAWGFTAQINGKQVRRYKAEWTRDDAEAELATALLRLEPENPKGAGITLTQAADRYLASKARRRTIEADRRQLDLLKAEFGGKTPLTEITASRISAYKAKRLATVRTIGKGEGVVERRLTAAAVNRPLALLRHLLRLAHEEWGELNAVPKIRTEKEPQGRLRWLTEDEARRLLAACRKSRNAALADLVEFCLFTGLRQGEALGLTWDRVDRSRGVVRLELTKSGRRREVPLGLNADAILARRWTNGAKGYVFGACKWNSFRSAWEAALAAAGIESFRFHDLRHTFASWLVQRGRTLKEVQEALGHQTITMTMRYSHLAPDHLRAAVAALDGMLPAPQQSERAETSAQDSAQEVLVEAIKGSR